MEDKAHINNLFKKYLDGSVSEAELDELLRYFHLTDHSEVLHELILQELDQEPDADATVVAAMGDQIAKKLFQQTKPSNNFQFKRWLAYAAAALLFGAIGFGTYRYLNTEGTTSSPQVVHENIIQPGGNRATITLDNGQVVVLREDQEGIVNKGDALFYADGSPVEGLGEVQQVRLTTPRAGQYTVTLHDGTKVWLNAASELIYPLHFDSRERHVQVDGEAYFEVAHNPLQPFVVKTQKQQIHVLGTRFNVHAYTDEAMQHTTLEQGAVEIQSPNNPTSLRLKPGQQAFTTGTEALALRTVDPQEYISWKDGIIMLNSYDLPEILRQLERWYDVEFSDLPAGITSDRVFGMIQRDVPLNDVLQTLKDNYNTIQFKINGRRIMVSKR
ncbi:FecR family protein [Sphingobacterium psychroaquaticum]|uniref:FecR family protein n=1 Tax=Sphingobacterium psychroaquaticum TaxID=561061 RepID=A0A1X7KSQ8_9SPHI|nr:FecR domain-containing protein [Sphingobacterium psychroaquaticum]SMG44557.1 FecR family protein [Sphingobacterium psychroaquaticum]